MAIDTIQDIFNDDLFVEIIDEHKKELDKSGRTQNDIDEIAMFIVNNQNK